MRLPPSLTLPLLVVCAAGRSGAQIQAEILDVGPSENSVSSFVSDDGSVVAGTRRIDVNTEVVFRWTAGKGSENLVLPSGNASELIDMSGDGSVILAWVENGNPVIWEADGTVTEVVLSSTVAGDLSAAAISHDGTTVVGAERVGSAVDYRGFTWTAAGGIHYLGSLAGSNKTFPSDVSADGAWVVGQSNDRIFRWSLATGMAELPIPVSSEYLEPQISADGQVVVTRTASGVSDMYYWSELGGTVLMGSANDFNTFGPYLSADGSAATWHSYHVVTFSYVFDANTGVTTSLGPLEAYSISNDGSAIGGYYYFEGDGYRWTMGSGLEPLDGFGAYAVVSAISGDGQWLIGSLGSASDAGYSETAVRWNVGQEIGGRYCRPLVANSTGTSAELRALGTNQISRNDVTLRVTSLPPSTFGFFLASQEQGDTFPVSQSQGRLCLGGAIGRFVRPHQIKNSGPGGEFEFHLPLNAIATPAGQQPVLPGDAWNFQAWYRDANPSATSNLTNAVRLGFGQL